VQASAGFRLDLVPVAVQEGRMSHPLLMMNLLTAFYWFDEALQASLEASGYPAVSRAQSLLLANVASGERRPSGLARNLGVSRQAISQMLAACERDHLVRLAPDPTDGRARIVEFHPDAEPLREAASRALREAEQVLGRRIGAERLAQLVEALSLDWGPPPQPQRKA